jgi:flagellar biosynthesis/type III secretory pathway protein FliH
VHAEALQRLAEARENDYRRYLLLDCLEAYATLDEAQARELGELLQTERYRGAHAMAMTTFEKGVQAGLQQGLQQGLEQGLEQGLQRGQWTTLQKQLEARFGALSPGAQQRLEGLDSERLAALALALLKAQSLRELGLED